MQTRNAIWHQALCGGDRPERVRNDHSIPNSTSAHIEP
jgi:hypothetical protein